MCIAIFGGEKNIELDFLNDRRGDIEQFNGGWRKFIRNVIALSVLLAMTCVNADNVSLGTKEFGMFSLKGAIYFISEDTDGYTLDIETKYKPVGYIYANKLDVPLREFSEGFPGITDRFEWFGIIYDGTFEVTSAGTYKFDIASDDGSRLWIDGAEIINNDGVHAINSSDGDVKLSAGMHSMKVWYFQGPAYEIALQLFVTKPNAEAEIFDMRNFNRTALDAAKKVNATTTAEGIRVQLDAAILFDSGKYDLKDKTTETIRTLGSMLKTYPHARVIVDGHTDNVGEDAANQVLSENRAKSVEDALRALNVGDIHFESRGFGETAPTETNDTPAGRAKNRRVEVLIIP